jgi:hypothetical protein
VWKKEGACSVAIVDGNCVSVSEAVKEKFSE